MIIQQRLISTRATTILERFPRHLDLTREDKVFAQVVDGLSRELDVKTMQIGRVRKSHRLDQAEELRDLLLLAGLHDLRPIRFDLARLRLEKIGAVAKVLTDSASDATARDEAVTRLTALLPLADLGGYAANQPALAAALADLTGFASQLAILRYQIKALIRIHRDGNGSVRSLLEACAAYLHLQVNQIAHVGNDYWHIAYCNDLITLPLPAEGVPASVTDDWLALEENPFKETAIAPEPYPHGGRRKIIRNGFDPVPVAITITGIEDRTWYPMVVDVDKGHGLYYAGQIEDGQILEFTADGRVLLAGAPADNRAFAFTGGVFAEESGRVTATATEFAFCTEQGTTPHGQAAVFVETAPVTDGFSATMPHMGGLSPVITLAVGATNLRFFVRIAHFGSRFSLPPTDQAAKESYSAGCFDTSLFALDQTGAGSTNPAALLGFAWEEREAFKVRVWLPSRFESYDADNGQEDLPLADRLRPLLDRHRAAGINLEVCYASDLWELPVGILTDPESPQSYLSIISGSRLWKTGSPQPTS